MTLSAHRSLCSTPDTVVWGYISSRTPPVLRIKSGSTVRLDTMSHQGLTGVDVRVAEAVDSMLLIYGVVPKKFFKQNPAYWGASNCT